MSLTEQEWLECDNPLRLLRFAQRSPRCRREERVWRLLACAVARRVWHTFNGPCRRGVETAERFADGRATAADMEAADNQILRNQHEPCRGLGVARWTLWGPWRGHDTLFRSVTTALQLAASRGEDDEEHQQCLLIRDLFGNPFRPSTLEPAWLAWHRGAVSRLARGAYEERLLPSGLLDNVRLAILADALEEAGCSETALLEHCREPNPHARGCWLLDLILAKDRESDSR